MKPFLSKSTFLDGMRCLKLLWFDYFRREAFPPEEGMYDEGKDVEAYARGLLPDGMLLGRQDRPQAMHTKSLEALGRGAPLFQAGFVSGRLYAIADILCPAEDGGWDLYEVKSSTSVKQDHLYDMAFQRHVYRGAGLDLRRCFVMYVNNRYVRRGDLDLRQLFLRADLTEGAQDMELLIRERCRQFLDVLSLDEAPEIAIGPQCLSPRECPLRALCWKHIPERDHVFALNRGKELAFTLAQKGILSLFEVPDELLNARQRTQVESHRTNVPFINPSRLKRFLGTLRYPVSFLDFETIGPAIPVFDGTRPYEQIPFQFSLFVRDAHDAEPRYHAYLARDTQDPRPRILEELTRLLGSEGSIVAYNAKFEISVLRAASVAYPRYRDSVERLAQRFVDLLEPFMGFYYYHPAQEGRNSLKFVLPALTGTSYKGLAISNGIEASARYYRVTYGRDVDGTERERIYAALEEYCRQDTQGMIDVLDVLLKTSTDVAEGQGKQPKRRK
jgi:hypothetical protein